MTKFLSTLFFGIAITGVAISVGIIASNAVQVHQLNKAPITVKSVKAPEVNAETKKLNTIVVKEEVKVTPTTEVVTPAETTPVAPVVTVTPTTTSIANPTGLSTSPVDSKTEIRTYPTKTTQNLNKTTGPVDSRVQDSTPARYDPTTGKVITPGTYVAK